MPYFYTHCGDLKYRVHFLLFAKVRTVSSLAVFQPKAEGDSLEAEAHVPDKGKHYL